MLFRWSDKKNQDDRKSSDGPGRGAAAEERDRELEDQFKIELMPGLSDQARNYLAGDFEIDGVAEDDRDVETINNDAGIDIIISQVIEPAEVDYSKVERLQKLLLAKQEEIERLKNERFDIEAKEILYYSCFHSLPLPMLLISQHNLEVKDANAAASSLLGTWRNQLVGRSLRAMIPENTRPSFETFLVSLMSDNSSVMVVELKLSENTSKMLTVSGTPVMFNSRLIGYQLQLAAKA